MSSSNRTDLTLEQFGKDFKSPKDFIEIISRKYVFQQSNKDKEEGLFDSHVFEELFENNMKSLLELQTKLDKSISKLTKECTNLEKNYKTRLAEIISRSDRVFKEFKTIESTINKISTKTASIGGSLESVELQRNRAIEAKVYFNYIIELNDENAKISKIFADNSDYDNAILIKNLMILAQELDMPHTENAKMNIEKAAENMEKTQLERFIRAFQEKKYIQMKECARTLFELNGGDSCVRSYINQLKVLIDNADDIDFKVPSSKANNVNNEHENEVLIFEEKIKKVNKFAKDVYDGCLYEYDVIMKVFPSPSSVIQRLVQRVIEQRIHTFIQHLMLGVTKEPFLKLLYHACNEMNNLLNRLVNECPVQLPKILFKKLLDGVFSVYRESYIKVENQTLIEFISNEMLSNMGKQKSTFLLTPDSTIRCLERAENAVDRCLLLSPSKFLGRNLSDIFLSFIGSFSKHLGNSLEVPMKKLNMNSTVQEISDIFMIIQSINTSTVLLRKYYFDKISPHLENDIKYQTLCLTQNRTVNERLELLVDEGLDRVLSTQIAHIERILYREQKKSDFKTNPNDPPSLHASKACIQVCEFLKNQLHIITSSLDGKNVETYLVELGTRTLNVILNHIKKFTIEKVTGGLSLMRDAIEYQERINTFKIPSLSKQYEILKSITKLHIVNPHQIKDLIEDTELSKLPKHELLQYIKQRSDYDKSWNEKYL